MPIRQHKILSSESGIAQLAMVLLILAGVAIGTYVVQNRTNFAPKASTETCSEDTTYCDNGTKIHKKGGYWDGSQCVYDFVNEGSCDKSPDNEGGSSSGDKECGTTFREGGNGDTSCKKPKGVLCTTKWNESKKSCTIDSCNKTCVDRPNYDNENRGSSVYDQGDCRDGAVNPSKDGYKWIAYCDKACSKNSDCPQNTSEGAVNPKDSNWCFGFNGGTVPRCMKLVQTDNKEIDDSKRKTTNTKVVDEIKTQKGGSSPAKPPTGVRQSSSVEFNVQIEEKKEQRGTINKELDSINNASISNKLKGEIVKAKSLLTTAITEATKCYTGIDKLVTDPCVAVAQAAHDIAVAAYRVVAFDAVAEGVTNVCVKVDMSVGENKGNSKIEVNPINDPTFVSRLYMCRGTGGKDGEILWKAKDKNEVYQDITQETLNRLGLKKGLKNITKTDFGDFIIRRDNAAALSGLPTYTAPEPANATPNKTKSGGPIPP